MVIFHSYVKLPEGNLKYLANSKGLSGRSSFAWAFFQWAAFFVFSLKFQKGFDFFCDPCATNVSS